MFAMVALAGKAQEPTDTWVKTFCASVAKGETDKAVDDLFTHIVLGGYPKDGIENLKGQLASTTKLIGKYHGYRLVAKRELATALRIEDYMVLFDRQPLRFRFEFYKPDGEWMLYSFSYDADLDDDLEQGVKTWDYFDH